MNAHGLRRIAGKIASTVAEMNEAQRRMTVLRTAPDRYLLQANDPPDTYAEFLARTSGALLHEPPAGCRG